MDEPAPLLVIIQIHSPLSTISHPAYPNLDLVPNLLPNTYKNYIFSSFVFGINYHFVYNKIYKI